ncbi:MAG: TonB-dependent receptor [Betaproteobacteria bacterium]|nr:TonB-dependent receptor [Betaproteobacteria bacterium]
MFPILSPTWALSRSVFRVDPRSASRRAAAVLAALGATVTLPCAQAQAPEPLQSVVTVASRLPQTPDRLTADAVVITREQLALLPADNLADALQALAGVQVSRTGGPGQPTSVLIRGAAASNTLVLVDGVRMGSATLGQFDFSTIGLAGIERIEVLRGPGASVYGADAVGGVVLVTTRAARPYTGRSGPNVDGSATVLNRFAATGGSQSSSDVSASTQVAQGPWDAQLQWARQASAGVNAVRPGDRFGLYNPDADGYRRQTLLASGGWQLAPGHRVEASALQARLFSRYDSAEYAPPTYAPNPLLDFSTRTDTSASALRYEGRYGALTWRARLGRGVEDSTSGARQLDTYRTERNETGLQVAWALASGHDLLAAWDRLEEQVRTNNYSTPAARDNDALTLAYTGQFGAVQVQADGREDRNSVYGTHRTGRTGLRWALTRDTSVRVLAATTFRAPSFNELYFPLYGVPTLAPEQGRSLEAGLAQRMGRAQWQATVWRNHVDDLIGYSADPARCPRTPAYAFGCAANFGKAELKGYTLETQWPVQPGSAQPTWRLAYDGVDARDGKGQALPRRARHQWRLQSQHTLAGWQLGTAWLWQSERREAGTVLREGTRLDLQALRKLGAAMPGWSLRVSVLNALDRDIEPALDYRAPGRQFFAGLRWEGR